MSRPHAYRFIDTAEVVQNLSPIGDKLPTTESQARPLTKLEPEQQQEAGESADCLTSFEMTSGGLRAVSNDGECGPSAGCCGVPGCRQEER